MMRMSTVFAVRKTFGILIVVLMLITLYWNYKLHVTNGKKYGQLYFDSLNLRNSERNKILKKSSTPSNGDRTTYVLSTTRGSNSDLLQKLSQLEARLNQSQAISRMIFIGSEDTLEAELPLYTSSLKKLGYTVDIMSKIIQEDSDDVMIGWSGVMCYAQRSSEKHPCFRKEALTQLKLHHKVSYIPGFDKILIQGDKFCYTMSAAHHLPALATSPLSLPCYVLPFKSKGLAEKISVTTDNATVFLIRTLDRSSFTFTRGKPTNKRFLQMNGILHIIHSPLLINSQPVIITMYVLITSVSPLRVYRHHDGIAKIVTQDKVANETWTLHNVDVYLSESYSSHQVAQTWSRVDQMIVETLMIGESSLFSHLSERESLIRSSNFFQLLEFHFTFNSSLYPFLVEVKFSQDGSTLPDVVGDVIQLLFNASSSADHVHNMLENLNKTIGVESTYCHKEHFICLNENELVYELENHRETAVLGRFKKLYPVTDGRMYEQLLDDLQTADHNSLDSRLNTLNKRGTPQLHRALSLMESYREQGTGTETDVQHVDQRKGYWATDEDDYPDKISAESSHDALQSGKRRPNCDEDSSKDPVLTAIYIEPTSAEFNTAFKPEITEYAITFPFDVAVVKVWGKTSTCNSEARVNSRTAASVPANYSIGVGWNKFAIHLVDSYHTSPSLIVTYNINIYRRGRTSQEKSFNNTWKHQMCSLKQDCDLKAFPGQPCGPHSIRKKSMKEFLESRDNLPWCKNGDVPGTWVLPCINCSDSSSCFWREAKWTPAECEHRTLSIKDAKNCLANKKILFVGDSTNRGIMYYVMEKINGSLREWEKTHSMKVYRSALNDDRTSVSFAYYPQFWLPPERKPVFLKALQHLMARFMPLKNSTNTILVVGGVQWLLPSHVMAIKTTLSSLGLTGIKVIIKTLGSGFHLPVPGFVKLNLEGQQKVAQRNQMVIKAAKTSGFDVVDTYTMTLSRHKEFLMGKCGCHFHKVVDLRSHGQEYSELPSELLETSESRLPRFHVIGPINSAYSEIVINRMCS